MKLNLNYQIADEHIDVISLYSEAKLEQIITKKKLKIPKKQNGQEFKETLIQVRIWKLI